jgi:hypothetical protein
LLCICRVKLVDCDPQNSKAISKLGFDPLLELPSLEQFAAALAAKSKGAARLKPLLLDQVWCGSVVHRACCRKVLAHTFTTREAVVQLTQLNYVVLASVVGVAGLQKMQVCNPCTPLCAFCA